MNIIKSFAVLGIIAGLMSSAAVKSFTSYAESEAETVYASADRDTSEVQFDFSGCKAAVVYECSTGTVLAGSDEHMLFDAGHFSKLMTALLAAEQIEQGTLSFDDEAVCSKLANSQGDPQIWLNYGESITVDELLKAICIGNANDAEAVLCEKMYPSSKDFTDAVQCKVKYLFSNEAEATDVSDLQRISRISVVGAAKLCTELVKYESLTKYYTTWMDSVRNGKAQLVSRNRLIRSYKGMIGFKVFYTQNVGYCAAVCAKRDEMTVCVVMVGMNDEDELTAKCRKSLDTAFSAYSVFEPKIPEEAVKNIKIIHGQKPSCETNVPYFRPVVIKNGSGKEIKCSYKVVTELEAPVFKGMPVGKITFTLNDNVISEVEVCTAENIDEADMKFNLKRLLENLLKF